MGKRGVLPYFIRSEGNSRLSGPMHGTGGPLGVSDIADPHPLSSAFVQAAQQFGLPYNADFNSGDPLGVGFYQTTTKNGRRFSAAVTYLGGARGRANLTILTDVFAKRVTLDGKRASGVEFIKDGTEVTVRTDREVIVSSGAFGSPRVLQHSGIGDPAVLEAAGVQVRHELVGVGKNLQDHCDLDIVYELKDYGSMDRYNLVRPATAIAGLQYMAFRSGPLSSTVVEAIQLRRQSRALTRSAIPLPSGIWGRGGIAAVRPGFGSPSTPTMCSLVAVVLSRSRPATPRFHHASIRTSWTTTTTSK